MPEHKQLHIFVSGVVQGVGFREFSRRSAAALNLTGWTRNLPDGRVELVVQGRPDSIEKLLEQLRKGPPAASVTAVQSEEEPPDPGLAGFEIRRTERR